MTARVLMVQGTASSVGKSIVTAALCRFFRQEGLRVAPFKAQNMALNAYVTPDGGEIGRAQAVQARAAGVEPTVDMNPILLKPEGDARCQVIVHGRVAFTLRSGEYFQRKQELRAVVRGSLDRLRSAYDVVVVEGAGSPAEVNLKEHDLVNMFVAGAADCKVILVGDIDRGGVFAALVGTLELLEPHERARVGALLVNKFRGDVALLEPGLRFLEERTGIPVLGVLPYVRGLTVADEDSVSLEERLRRRRAGPDEVEIAVVRLPRIANHDDFQPLEHEPGVVLRVVENAREVEGADLVVLPGTKGTRADLRWLRESGLADAVVAHARRGGLVLGVCGGCQMLGGKIEDPGGVESSEASEQGVEGLGLLGIDTHFVRDKRTTQVRARATTATFLCDAGDTPLAGYEIHMGRVVRTGSTAGVFAIDSRNGQATPDVDGAVSSDGAVVGTMVHGLFENAPLRRRLIATLRERRGLCPPVLPDASAGPPDDLDRIAAVVRDNVDVALLYRLLG